MPGGSPGAGRAVRAGPWLGRAAAILGAAVAAFLITNPYVVLDWGEWSRGFLFQVNAYLPATRLDQVATAAGKQVAALWATDGVLLAAGAAGALILLGDALRLRRLDAPAVRAAWLLLPFPVVYTLLMSRFTEVYERNLIITLPCLCLAGGYGAARLAAAVARVRLPAGRAAAAWRNPALIALILGLVLAAEPARRSANFTLYMAMPESRNLAWAWLQDALQAGHRAAVELHPWQVCAPPPYPCAAPDVYDPGTQLTVHPPTWYAAHGYDYVLLVGTSDAIVANPSAEGPRDPAQLAPFHALPLVREWPGDRAGDKGPDVWVVQTGAAPGAVAGMTPSGARFGAVAALAGYALGPLPTAGAAWDPATGPAPAAAYRPGAAAGIRLYWRALPGAATTPGNWTVALHLLNTGGATVAQVDVVPISSGRLRPVGAWYPHEFLAGSYDLPLPPTLAPGTYHLTLALYDAPSGPGLPVQPAGGGAPLPALDLGALQVTR